MTLTDAFFRNTIKTLDWLIDVVSDDVEPPNTFRISGKITERVYDTAKLQSEIDGYSELSRKRKIEVIHDSPVKPERVHETSNVVLDDYMTYVLDNADPNQSPTAIDASHLAIGTDGSSVVSSDTSLGSEVARNPVDTHTDNGKELKTETLFDESEANGNTIRECGLVSASSGGTFFNHATVPEEDKTDEKTLTFVVALQIQAA